MKEARIIYPQGGPLNQKLRDAFHRVTSEFGGCTEYVADGYWKAPSGDVVQERVKIMDIAYVPNDENDAKLYDIAWAMREAGGQVEVYLRYGNGHVQMVSAMSCMDNGHGHFDLSLGGVLEAVNQLANTAATFEDRLSAFEYLDNSVRVKRAAIT